MKPLHPVLRQAVALALGLVVLGGTWVSATDCAPSGKLTPEAAATLSQLDDPLCEGVGAGVAVIAAAPAGPPVAKICNDVLDRLIAEDTDDAGPRAAVPRVLALAAKVAPGSPLLPIRGDAKQYGSACAELHPIIEAALVRAGK